MIKGKSRSIKNEEISAFRVTLISKDGENLGEKDTLDAISLAQNLNLDLVQVKDGDVPICKLMDFSREKYKKQKKSHKVKKPPKRKEIRFGMNITEHDMDIKINHVKKFISKGHEVKIVLQKKGRHLVNAEIESQLMDIVDKIGVELKKDSKINKNNRMWSVDLSP